MIFTEFRFLLFFIVAFGVYWLLPRNGPRKLWMLVSSYAFYAGWRWEFLGLIVASTLVDFIVGRMLDRKESPGGRRLWLILSLVVNLGMLATFKYFDFFVTSGVEFLNSLGIDASPRTLGFVIPVGISFYTFQTLSYTIDVYRGNLKPIKSLLDFAVFVAFFPQLVAGPIVRASEFLPQLVSKRRFSEITWRASSALFLFGYIKKACIADNVAPIVDQVFADPAAYGVLGKWLGLSLYSVQIYCDFSGYTDMAIAMAAFFGYQLTINFNFPYLAKSITEFWRRWHISLSSWFRDYLYIPLGGNRGSALATYRNLLIVFFLCGLWHGPSWNFVIWGLFHGVFLVMERVFKFKGNSAFGHIYTLFVVMMGWVFFRSADLPTALSFTRGLFGLETAGATVLASHWWAILGGFVLVHIVMSKSIVERAIDRIPSPLYSIAYGAAWALAFPWAAVDYQPFIYFQF